MERRILTKETKKFLVFTILLIPFFLQIMPEIRKAIVLAAMGGSVLSANKLWARNESFPLASLPDDGNPLYVQGMIKDRKWFSKINGYFGIQILLLLYLIAGALYLIYTKESYVGYRETGIRFLKIYSAIVIIQWLMNPYYIYKYKNGFSYPKDKNGIWMPFSFLGYQTKKRSGKSYPYLNNECDIGQGLDLAEALLKNNYLKKAEYEMGEHDKVCFYQKNKKYQTNLWAVIEATDVNKEYIQQLNDLFAKYWTDKMTEEEKRKNVRFTFVLQVEKINDFTAEIFSDASGIYMDNYRSRLAVLYEREHDILKIKWPDYNSKYKNIHSEMRKELKQITGDKDFY